MTIEDVLRRYSDMAVMDFDRGRIGKEITDQPSVSNADGFLIPLLQSKAWHTPIKIFLINFK